MRKLFAVLMLLFAVISLAAQDHLTFKGIPIKGSMISFCQKLKAKGFTSISPNDRKKNYRLFLGDFAGQKSFVEVVATDDGKSVYGVIVTFGYSDEWKTLVSTYDYYKNLYIRKYGTPVNSEEYNPAYPDSNTALMGELYEGTVDYHSSWRLSDGLIILTINKGIGSFYEGAVWICYYNSQYMEDKETKLRNELDDI